LNLLPSPLDQNSEAFLNGGLLGDHAAIYRRGFTPEFLRKLPLVEQAMLAHGLEPAQFVISKDRATPPTVPFVGPFFYDYTVFVGDEKFTVTEPNDIRFLDYFYQRCVAEDESAPAEQHPLRPNLISRLFRWMAQPI
jgi:hypothetical protein